MPPLALGVIGCGDVAAAYGEALERYPELLLGGAVDRNPPRTEAFVERFGGVAHCSVGELLADASIDIVLNLTRQHSHFEVTAAALEARKHVYSEKPLAMSAVEARMLVDLAAERGVRLACAPLPYAGAAQRKVWDLLRADTIGRVRLVYAEANWGRIERWHPRPQEFYDVGPVFDVGVYPITLLTSYFGPVRRVIACSHLLLPERMTSGGEPFRATAPDFSVALLELDDGPAVRLSASFYTPMLSKQRGVELFGDAGSIYLSSWLDVAAGVEVAHGDAAYELVAFPGDTGPRVDFARGLAELACAIVEDRPHAASGEHAAHVVEVLQAIGLSASACAPIEIVSAFDRRGVESILDPSI